MNLLLKCLSGGKVIDGSVVGGGNTPEVSKDNRRRAEHGNGKNLCRDCDARCSYRHASPPMCGTVITGDRDRSTEFDEEKGDIGTGYTQSAKFTEGVLRKGYEKTEATTFCPPKRRKPLV